MKKKNGFSFNFIMRKIVNNFLQGLLFVSPIGLTAYLIFLAFQTIDGILSPIEDHFKFYIPGLGILAMLIVITILGYIGQTVIAKPFKALLERLITKAPFLNMVYSSIRDFMQAFVGKEKKFNQPVSVIVSNNPEIERFGFITQHDLSELNIPNKVAVYFPLSYAFTGELLIVPSEQVRTLDIPSGELMKFIVSGGVTRV